MARNRKHYRRGRRKKRGFASWSLGKKIASVFAGVFALVALTGGVILASKLSKIEKIELNADNLNISEAAKEQRERGTGYFNVALFGVDSREGTMEEGTLSDTIMIASLNRETLEVKIASIYRDTLLEQSDGTYNKANAAYGFGGPEAAVAMLNKNFDLDIDHYVTVNWAALIHVIDAVGGVEIDVQEEEVNLITGYATEIIKSTGIDSMGVFEPGPQVLNGVQATAYCRIRYTTGDDFRRTERQREVLTKVIEKLQNVKLSQLNKIIDKVFPMVSTNFTLTEIVDYAKDAFDYQLTETGGFPEDTSFATLSGIGSVVVPTTLESNVIKLHQFLFGDDDYTPSSTVSTISDNIAYKASTGGGESSDDTEYYYYEEDTSSNYNNSYDNSYDDSGISGNTGGNSESDEYYDYEDSSGSNDGGSVY